MDPFPAKRSCSLRYIHVSSRFARHESHGEEGDGRIGRTLDCLSIACAGRVLRSLSRVDLEQIAVDICILQRSIDDQSRERESVHLSSSMVTCLEIPLICHRSLAPPVLTLTVFKHGSALSSMAVESDASISFQTGHSCLSSLTSTDNNTCQARRDTRVAMA